MVVNLGSLSGSLAVDQKGKLGFEHTARTKLLNQHLLLLL